MSPSTGPRLTRMRAARARRGRTRLVVVDDPRQRAEVRVALEGADIEVVAEAGCVDGALTAVERTEPDVVLVKARLQGTNETDLVRELRQHAPASRIVVLAVSRDRCDLLDALRAGASGVVTSDGMEPAALVRTLAAVVAGEIAIPRVMAGDATLELAARTTPEVDHLLRRLTERERQVLRLLAIGSTDREIATWLGVTLRTAQSHVSNLIRKLEVSNRTAAATRYR